MRRCPRAAAFNLKRTYLGPEAILERKRRIDATKIRICVLDRGGRCLDSIAIVSNGELHESTRFTVDSGDQNNGC